MPGFEDPMDSSAFISRDPAWARGVEVGMVYALMALECPRIEAMYHTLNSEQLFVLASRFGYEYDWSRAGKNHIHICFTRIMTDKEDSADSE